MIPPTLWSFDGEHLSPKHPRIVDRHYVIGEMYSLVPHEGRSQASHNHFFASVHQGWLNLPEEQAARFPTEESPRKWCLIKAGYRDERSIVAASKAEAQRIAAFIKPMDEYAVVTVSEAVVTVYTAKSQSMKAMGSKVFGESKQAVLDIISEMIGTDVTSLRNAHLPADARAA